MDSVYPDWIIPYSDLTNKNMSGAITAVLRSRRYICVHLPTLAESTLYSNRHEVFQSAFGLNSEIKESFGEHYKRNMENEFFETRFITDSNGLARVKPCLPIELYEETISVIMHKLHAVGKQVLRVISWNLQLDEAFLLDFVDSLSEAPFPHHTTHIAAATPSDSLSVSSPSSSLLRICKYANSPLEETLSFAFGAHTDTSLLTVAPLSSIPGLELFDPKNQCWRDIEMEVVESMGNSAKNCLLVLIGEFLQVFLKQEFCASVHRVRCPKAPYGSRYSSPLIMRPLPHCIFDPHNNYYVHPLKSVEGADLCDVVAALEGISALEIHRLLDLKRRRCAKEHMDDDCEWVLTAFP